MPRHSSLFLVVVTVVVTLFVSSTEAQSQTNLPPEIVKHSDPVIQIRNGLSTVVWCTIRYRGNYMVVFQRLTRQPNGDVIVTPLTDNKAIHSPDHLDKYQIRHDDQSDTWELTINRLTEEDEGNYECAVQTQPPTRQQFEISVQLPPIIINDQTSKDFSIKEFSEVDLKCVAHGDPMPKIMWSRHGGPPLPIGGQKWVGEKMHVHRILREDRGTYVCEASNTAGTVQRDINVEVQFAPSIETFRPIIVEHMENEYRRQQGYTQIGGSYAELDCDVIAAPRLQGDGVYWYVLDPRTQGRNRIRAEKFSHKYIIQTIAQANNEVISKLTIKNFADNDFRTYVCESANTEGTAFATIHLRNRYDADYIVITGYEGRASTSTPPQMALAIGVAFVAFLLGRR